MKKENKFRPFLLLLGIITFFIFVISFIVFYTTENFSPVCGCKLPPWLVIVIASSLGLFVGIITYYIISNNFIKEKKEIEKNLIKILDLLDKDEREILNKIIENKGVINQNSLTKLLNLNKVKVSRIISKMINKGIIKKERLGMTNRISLDEEIKDLFIR
ncbi:MAG: hypothetical protein QW117_02645 [Candidatus Pacearchaeota archaeon]